MPLVNRQFEDYYTALYGKRWGGLRESLLLRSAPLPYGLKLIKPYLLDRASVLAAQALRLPAQGSVPEAPILDACAAPGGKSLVIASRMAPEASLLSNELSGERRRRLAAVLDAHLPQAIREQVNVSGFDAAAAGGKIREHGRFAAILLDAPCSSERHVITSEKALGEWKTARPHFLARRQWALLSAAFLLLCPGGSLVYATCALTPEENDGVASRLLEKYKDAVSSDPPDFDEGEETRFGRIILPDFCGGMGPMYVARFKKRGPS
ncbi:SAM-dependent methyltransferase [Spirochaetia bacterium]|nr:SAM-dependent methyltransferase [Spirochaetia bacterium]